MSRAPEPVLTAFAIVASFSTYFLMYFFRRAFAAGAFEGDKILGLDAKSAYVIAQLLGYAASKFLGIKVVSELHAKQRARALLLSIGLAEASLVLFAVLPRGVAAVALAVNGLSLGMVWGMVFGFLEGRRTSDWLGAGLCASFIVASGAAKTVGGWFLALGVSESWMPAVTGLAAAPFMCLFVYLLAQIPPPTESDEASRTERVPMDRRARNTFFLRYAPGLVPLVGAYVLLTAFRDFRDNFAPEIWSALGQAKTPAIMTTAELPVAAGALVGIAAIGWITSNRNALLAIHGLLIGGAVIVAGSTLLFQAGIMGPITWMIAIGLGVYVAYVPYNCVLFDRLVAASGSRANAGFLIYVADASGYAGSVLLLVYKNVGQKNLSWVGFLESLGLFASGVIALGVAVSALYFWRVLAPVVTTRSEAR
ncbi:MAG: hypothetical protein HOW73_34350 [Polyangiaceae bacterium]|nr:hypothetical protein [Polyangiaceae bacterium]